MVKPLLSLQKSLDSSEWTFATKFASDCDCDGLVHSGRAGSQAASLICIIRVEEPCGKPYISYRGMPAVDGGGVTYLFLLMWWARLLENLFTRQFKRQFIL